MLQRKHNPGNLLEAAEYFQLDPAHMHLLGAVEPRRWSSQPEAMSLGTASTALAPSTTAPARTDQAGRHPFDPKSLTSHQAPAPRLPNSRTAARPKAGPAVGRCGPVDRPKAHHKTKPTPAAASSLTSATFVSHSTLTTGAATTTKPAPSPSNSTASSLPSLSSSPSVSPSLVCPHMSLSDLLAAAGRGGSAECAARGSPHTVGLCARCRLNPPPNIHSPLSPAFEGGGGPAGRRPVVASMARGGAPPVGGRCALRRGRSDHQLALPSRDPRKPRLGKLATARQSHDDSLDFGVDPRSLAAPTNRERSVDYIRTHEIEAARVIIIHKNGAPFDRPLRVSIQRGQFGSLNHLLDHINQRQLIPLGARYLFHMDGQLVYSVNELKHASIYLVSGTRSFDFKANWQLRERLASERTHLSPRGARPRAAAGGGTSAPVSRSMPASPQQSRPTSLERHPSQQSVVQASAASDGSRRQVTPAAKRGPMRDASVGTPSAKMVAGQRSRMSPGAGANSRSHPTAGARQLAKSNDDLSGLEEEALGGGGGGERKHDEPQVGVMRAKSELSALPVRRKKCVTFKDTGRGSSPAISTTTTSSSAPVPPPQPPPTAEVTTTKFIESAEEAKTLGTNDIGIQVSDSIEGFLIDLPVPLPARGAELADRRRRPNVRGPASRAGVSRVAAARVAAGSAGRAGRRQQVVAITERQLSQDELDKFRDLNSGDHYDHPNKRSQAVQITLEPADESSLGAPETSSIGGDSGGGDGSQDASQTATNQKPLWEYPEGDGGASPTERPISQSEASETVRAHVITPTPSLSTAGDSNSLTMSYEAATAAAAAVVSAVWTGGAAGRREPASAAEPRSAEARPQPQSQSEPRPRAKPPILGTLCPGVARPAHNFALQWVSGFTINDAYPLNSSSSLGHQQSGAKAESALLEPSAAGTSAGANQQQPQQHQQQQQQQQSFWPSERFANWVHHSRSFDELVYPAGRLVVLWSRWSNEQRYYAGHASSVSALTLASGTRAGGEPGDELAASAQIEDKPHPVSVHLWSLATLTTLCVVDERHLVGRRLFSLQVRRSASTNDCELSVGSRGGAGSERRLLVEQLHFRLATSGANNTAPLGLKAVHAERNLQAEQRPLLIKNMGGGGGCLPSTDRPPPAQDAAAAAAAEPLAPRPLLSFGRRHLQLWAYAEPGWRRNARLTPMQLSDGKSEQLVAVIGRANCVARLAPAELLVGSSDGALSLLELGLPPASSPSTVASKRRDSSASNSAAAASATAAAAAPAGPSNHSEPAPKYSVQLTALALAPPISAPGAPAPAITCVTRISGNLFASGDASSALRFWRIERRSPAPGKEPPPANKRIPPWCRQLGSISLPPDLGFICAIVLANYQRREGLVEFYAVSTSNAILFGSVQLCSSQSIAATNGKTQRLQPNNSLTSAALSVVYEGHETSVTNLVADTHSHFYFTCSVDCKISKWRHKGLIWKSLLPSAGASMAVHPTGRVLAVGSTDGTVYILDKLTGQLSSYFPLTPVCINCLAYSRDGSLLASGCANGSIFILPVYERGLKYQKVSIFQSPYPVVSLQFSLDNQFILTSVTHGPYQELILWDLPNFRYMRDSVKSAADKISWHESICSGSEDVRGIWDNANLDLAEQDDDGLSLKPPSRAALAAKRLSTTSTSSYTDSTMSVINLSCHRLERGQDTSLTVASDLRGFVRLFRYPCREPQQGFYEARVGSQPVNCCRFLADDDKDDDEKATFVSASLDGTMCLWTEHEGSHKTGVGQNSSSEQQEE